MTELDLENLGILAAAAQNAARYRVLLVAESAGLTAERLEREPGYSGTGLVLASEVKDQGGKGEVNLARARADLERGLRPLGKDGKLASFVIGFPGEGSEGAKASAGPAFHVPPRRLQAALQRSNGRPFANLPFRLEVDGAEVRDGGAATTTGDGHIDVVVPFGAKAGRITIDGQVFVLDIAPLEPADSVKGAQQRLQNLDYPVGAEDGVLSAQTREALRAFQRDHDLPVDGELGAATRAKLAEVHGS